MVLIHRGPLKAVVDLSIYAIYVYGPSFFAHIEYGRSRGPGPPNIRLKAVY